MENMISLIFTKRLEKKEERKKKEERRRKKDLDSPQVIEANKNASYDFNVE